MCRVLIVDSDPDFRRLCRTTAAKLKSDRLRLDETDSVSEALEMLARTPPDLVLADPEGIDPLVPQMRKLERVPKLLLVTDVFNVEILRAALRWHADDCLNKSDCAEELYACLSGLLNECADSRREAGIGGCFRESDSPTGGLGGVSERTIPQELRVKTLSPPCSINHSIAETVQELIRQHPSHMYTVQELSAYLGITPNYLSYLFKKETGVTLNAYQRDFKIEQAARLMAEQPRLRVYEIAVMLGFEDEKYFSRVFCRIKGMPPSEFRRNL